MQNGGEMYTLNAEDMQTLESIETRLFGGNASSQYIKVLIYWKK